MENLKIERKRIKDKKRNRKRKNEMKESITYCLKDYKNYHCWTSIGVITRADGQIAEVFKCSQCDKVMLENKEEIVRIYQ